MNARVLFALLWILPTSSVAAQQKVHPDSKVQEGVPQGEVEGPFQWKSEIFPGTVRDYWLYIPAQYDKNKPACVFIVQDGIGRARGWKLPTVMDNLIHKKQMPVTIGIFVSPGVVPAPNKDAQPRFNRSFEYDSMGDRYATFLLKEILPEVSKSYNLSDDPNDRCIGGASSGAICAFTAAWERPDQFRRVVSTIGTYVSLRGGNEYPVLVRKFETKPIRIFLEDGSNDLNIYGGDWWMANQTMLSALNFAGYDVKHDWSEEGHNGKNSSAIMPEILKWIWRDYPEPIKTGHPAKRRTQLVIPGEDWKLVSEGHRFTEGPAVNQKGELFFTDIPNSVIYRVSLDGKRTTFAENTNQANGLMFGPDGKLYACQNGSKQIVRYDEKGQAEVVVEDAPCNDLVVLPNGGYYTDPENSKVWYFTFNGKKKVVDTGIEFPNGVITSPDQTLLMVSDTRGRFTYSFQIQADGSLKHKQRYGHVHLDDINRQSRADGMTVDTQGRMYLTTRVGLQVFDQLGRCHLILNKPQNAWLSNVVFGGKENDTLFVTCGDKVYSRKIQATGVKPFLPPVKPPRPGL